MIVVAGEALVDLVPDSSGGLRVHYGGGPFNTARWLARLGQPVSFLGTFSDDPLGQRLRGALVQDGVGLELADRTALPTTLALAQLDDSGSATYRFYTEQTAAPALTAEHALRMLPDHLDVLHMGSLGLVLDPIADAVLQVAAAATEREALVMFDPNIRASLIADRDRYLDRFWRALRHTDVLKVSVEDLCWLIPDLPPRAAARELADAGPGVVIVTDGPRGAIIVGMTASEDLLIASPAAEVVDTVGAGDAFNAGFLAHWRHYGGRLDDRGAVSAATQFACLVAALDRDPAPASPPPRPPIPGSGCLDQSRLGTSRARYGHSVVSPHDCQQAGLVRGTSGRCATAASSADSPQPPPPENS